MLLLSVRGYDGSHRNRRVSSRMAARRRKKCRGVLKDAAA